MECDASFRRIGRAFVVVSVVRFVSVAAPWILLLSARACHSFGRLSLMGRGPHGLPWKSRQFVSSMVFLVALAVCSFFLLLLVVTVNQRLQTLGLAGPLTAARFHEEAGQVSAQLGVETGR